MYLSALRSVIEEMGGELDAGAVFPGGSFRIKRLKEPRKRERQSAQLEDWKVDFEDRKTRTLENHKGAAPKSSPSPQGCATYPRRTGHPHKAVKASTSAPL
jgi:hypothetical protein